ncbi:MAG: extracellular solute-binding protein family 5 [Geminicoccaceae bacterium]|nr:extracellular solute-binding protein family 5 [Geminicoccaceae bacterium]
MTGIIIRILGSALALAVANPEPAAAENVLRWASVGGALTFDPHAYDETPTNGQIRSVYEKLVDYDSDLELVPQLALAWRLIDPTTWEFELRPNVRFHDGTPFTAQDVVFSVMRAKTELPVGFANRIESIAAVRIAGEHSVRIETRFPDPQLWDSVRNVAIVSERWAEAHDVRLPANVSAGQENYASRHANGTGPFVLREFEPNGRVVMVRNPDWWGLARYPHNLDRIEFTPIADPEERLAGLLRGDLDLLGDPPLWALDRIERMPGLKLAQAPELRTIHLGLDQSRNELRSSDVKGRNPFSDKRVRQAIYQAIDIEAIRRNVMRGLAIPAGMLVAPGAVGYAPELDQRLPYDPELAKRLLSEAGYPEGFSVTLDCPNNRWINDEAICRAVAGQLGAVGIDVNVNAQPKQLFFAKLDNRETDFYLNSWATHDSQVIFVRFYRTRGGENAPGYSNPRVDRLIEQIDREMITYGRDALVEQVWQIVLDDIVYVPLHHQMIVWAMRENLDLPVYRYNQPIFREARFE